MKKQRIVHAHPFYKYGMSAEKKYDLYLSISAGLRHHGWRESKALNYICKTKFTKDGRVFYL